ncbi:hypothetical protein EG329_010196 [Mollisiaceae sp. DMI_Dod_QoI]|nr:hypothetical protein EG329_010196 [Helotiales sp. DMI_Dod_QoI]
MFAVPGWSVDTSLLKTQTVESSNKAKNSGDREDNGNGESKPSKKRKRSGKEKVDVNPGNLADMWENVIEGKERAGEPKEPGEKRQKIAEEDATQTNANRDEHVDEAENPVREKGKKEKTKKDKKREKKAKLLQSQDTSASAAEGKPPPPAQDAPTSASSKPASTLTPLQASMRAKLISARFRHLNQQLYTTPSADSLSLFQSNPEMFTEYHEGFRKQVEVWPENPVDGYIRDITLRGKIRGPSHKDKNKKKGKDTTTDISNDAPTTTATPLPRTEGTCTIADLGCGDATLSTALQPHTKKLNLKIHSFDLQSPSPLVTRADIANLPLPDGSVDIAIFCLALMGTNWVDFIEEAFRILRWKGELWVAEIKSRFGRVASAGKKGKVVEHSVGHRKKVGKEGMKIQRKIEEESNDAVAAIEVDGIEDRGGETDVSAFVEVLRKRGFVLRGEGKVGDNGTKAVDLKNKMFVRMWFVKGATPIKGKGVPVPKGGEQHGLGETWKKKPKGKFIDEDEEVHVSSEAGVLKPCVYKLR